MGKLQGRNTQTPNPFHGHNKIPTRIPSPTNGAASRAASLRRRSIRMLVVATFVFVMFFRVSTQKQLFSEWEVIERDAPPSGENSYQEKQRLRLRYDWTNLSPSLELTKHIRKHQSDCSLPMGTFVFRNRFGLGSDFFVYSHALAYGIHTQKRIRTVGNWTWMDKTECRTVNEGEKDAELLGSPMSCYFAASELNCPGDVEYAIQNPGFDESGALSKKQGRLINLDGNYNSSFLPSRDANGWSKLLEMAVVESLFTSVTPRVVQEAERQLNLVFGEKVPEDLITVHIRWGDKVATYEERKKKIRPEMKKVDISDYIAAIQQILDQRERTKNSSSTSTGQTANIFLATEDPEAVKHFREALPEEWNLFVDQFLIDTIEHRIDDYNGNPRMANEMNGKAGLLTLGSLLVAMEANDYVLTTKSNWSQMMEILRKSILDPRCGNCTSMIDLRARD